VEKDFRGWMACPSLVQALAVPLAWWLAEAFGVRVAGDDDG
jgi:hypothetical protein